MALAAADMPSEPLPLVIGLRPTRLLALLPGKVPGARGLSALKWAPDSSKLGILVEAAVAEVAVNVHEEEPPRTHLFAVDGRGGGAARRVSPDDLHVWEFAWAPDAVIVAATASDDGREPSWYDSRLVQFSTANPDDCDVVTLWQWHGPRRQISCPCWAPDGKGVAFISSVLSDRGYIAGDVFVVDADGSFYIRDVPEGVRANISPDGRQAWDITHGLAASVSWIDWVAENEMLAMAHEDGGSAIYELEPESGGRMRIWQSAMAVAEACWPRFSRAVSSGVIAVAAESAHEPREVWATEHHRQHRSISAARIERVVTGGGASPSSKSPGGKEFTLYELKCRGMLVGWTVLRRYAEFADLRDELVDLGVAGVDQLDFPAKMFFRLTTANIDGPGPPGPVTRPQRSPQ
jgi:dipeptidyl aminopeptidase/acylaminoacyl peptidase